MRKTVGGSIAIPRGARLTHEQIISEWAAEYGPRPLEARQVQARVVSGPHPIEGKEADNYQVEIVYEGPVIG